MSRLEEIVGRLGDSYRLDSAAYAFITPRRVKELRAFVELLDELKVGDDAVLDEALIYVRLDLPGASPFFSYCANHFVAEGDQYVVGVELHECGDSDA